MLKTEIEALIPELVTLFSVSTAVSDKCIKLATQQLFNEIEYPFISVSAPVVTMYGNYAVMKTDLSSIVTKKIKSLYDPDGHEVKFIDIGVNHLRLVFDSDYGESETVDVYGLPCVDGYGIENSLALITSEIEPLFWDYLKYQLYNWFNEGTAISLLQIANQNARLLKQNLNTPINDPLYKDVGYNDSTGATIAQNYDTSGDFQ